MNTRNIIRKYNPTEIEAKCQGVWEKERIYSPNLDQAQKPFYNLMMFPYPSAEGMHVGNMYAFTGTDVYGRFQRMRGYDVLEPIGLDGFGIHSENYAIKKGIHPAEQAKISEANFYRQLRSIGNSFDWDRTVETYKPEYYKWTQWLFIQLFKKGLAYRKKAPVNFCPSCKTVLSDEQAEGGLCERCSSVIEKKDLEQWFFKITDYAQRLLDNIGKLDWSEKVKIAQKQWIGRSEGALVRFKIDDLKFKNKEIEVFTTRPDTLFGATFMVLSPEHPIVASLDAPEVKRYVAEAKKKTDREKEKDPSAGSGLGKTGVFSGLYVINPVNKAKIPVWIADYVMMSYGTGAIMAVPAHDERDFEFAKKFNLDIKQVVSGGDVSKEAYVGEGEIINSKDWDGWGMPESIGKVIVWLEKKGLGKKEVNFHLRDWLISRQRYWGPPIPMLFCESCVKRGQSWFNLTKENEQKVSSIKYQVLSREMAGWYPEENLPVELPFIKDYKPLGTGVSPLASHPEFYKTTCPKCGGEARRETDVSDTFLDSSWYFLRYVSTDIDNTAFDAKRVKKWLPVNMYIGGAEHSVLHLLYSRFITMVLKDLGMIDFEEPFAKFRAHGLIVKDGTKMSKSKGNVVVPDKYIRKFGADTLRSYLMFMGPFSQGGDFRDTGIEGMHRFIKRVWTLLAGGARGEAADSAQRKASTGGEESSDRTRVNIMHKTIKRVTEDIESLSYNTAIAALMEWYNFLNEGLRMKNEKLSQEEVEVFLKLLAPFVPHLCEELYQNVILSANERSDSASDSSAESQNDIAISSIHTSSWPMYDPKYLVKQEAIIIVQVNGKLRGNIRIKNEELKIKNLVEEAAKKEINVAKHLQGKTIRNIIYVEGKVMNFVVS